MPSSTLTLPNEIIRVILFDCQMPRDYLAQSLINRQWSSEAFRLTSLMKRRFARQIRLLSQGFIQWDFDVRLTVIGFNDCMKRHGREECVATYHRVGGSSCGVFYLERWWQDGKLHGQEILREINTIWHELDPQRTDRTVANNIEHPYEGLSAVDSMRIHGGHFLAYNKISRLLDNCDCLGEMLFQYQWLNGSSTDSKQPLRTIANVNYQSDVNYLYEYIDRIDLLNRSSGENHSSI
jgi:hypothetical protein